MGLKEQAYNALRIAAERMGANNFSAGYAQHIKAGKAAKTYRYAPTDAHRQVIEAMPRVLSGAMSPNDAMALLHEYDVFKERMGK